MNYTKEQIQKVRDKSVADLLLMKNTGRKVMIKCPSPSHRDSSPSFQIRPDNTWKCFGCDAHGSGMIDLLVFLGYSFNEIMNEFGEH